MSNDVVYLLMQEEPQDPDNSPRLPVKLLQQIGAQHLCFLFFTFFNLFDMLVL
jgi:hypothetical protein